MSDATRPEGRTVLTTLDGWLLLAESDPTASVLDVAL
jgi:hypothetical protein